MRGLWSFPIGVPTASTALSLRRRIATVFQEPLLLNESVYANAALGLRLRGTKRDEIDRRLRPWLERLKIAHLATRPARTLSGGEAQRTSLARALVLQPDLLLLDEPFSALDASGRESLLRDFQRIVKETGVATVLVTHDRNEAYALADRIAVLVEGRLAQVGSKDEVYSRPATEVVAAIVGIENRLQGQVEAVNAGQARLRIGAAAVVVPGKFPLGAKVVLCIRAEDLSLAQADASSAGRPQFQGTITEVITGMQQWRCVVACAGFDLIAAAMGQGCSQDAFTAGKKITVASIPPELMS